MSDTYQDDEPRSAGVQTIEEPQNVRAEIQEARALIPVGPTGAAPMNFAQQVDFAKTMALAKAALPPHLRNNAGDCLAIIDIASRAGLSPYMLASKTYVQNDRLCFESQAYHALAQSSGLMNGEFEIQYEGEGAARICIVSGFLKGDPRQKTHRSPPLGELHPGYSLKTDEGGVKTTKTLSYVGGQKLKAEAAAKGETVHGLYCKGSPLWDRKPDVQHAYDTIRDWVRLHAPRATLGVYTVDEIQDHADHFALEQAKSTDTLKDKLATADRTEGHQNGFADSELANLAADKPGVVPKEPAKDVPKDGPLSVPCPECGVPAGHQCKVRGQPRSEPHKNRMKRADKKVAPKKPEPEKPAEVKPEDIKTPATAAQYVVYANGWIEKVSSRDDAEARWEGEADMRTDLTVSMDDRTALYRKIDVKFPS